MVFKPQTFHGETPAVEAEIGVLRGREQAVADLLAVTDGVDASDVTVTDVKGDIVLTGSVGQEREIERLVEIARAVPGVENILLKLRVRDPLSGSGG